MNEIMKKNAITYGVISGLFMILATGTAYAVDQSLFTAWWFNLLQFIVILGIGIALLIKTKKELNGVFPFKEAFTTYFLSSVIATVIAIGFNIILFNFIDTEAKENIQQLITENAVEMMRKFNAPAESIKEAVAQMKESNQFDTMNQLKGMGFSLIFSAIVGLILAAIFKSKTVQE